MTNNYVDNEKLYREMVKFTQAYNKAKADDQPVPRVNNYIGECIWLIANGLSMDRKFAGYTYKDEMVGDAIENCLRYLHNFDPEKSKNPFAYFTQIMYYAFLRRIEKEKRQTYVKYKTMEISSIMTSLEDSGEHHIVQMTLPSLDYEKMSALNEKYETKDPAKTKKKKTGLERIIGDENE